MKSFAELNTEMLSVDQDNQRAWIINQVENTERTHDDIKKEFVKKFGSKNEDLFDAVVSEIVD